MNSERGFSLVELLVALSIVLMIATFIIPAFTTILVERKNLVLRNEGNILMQEQIYSIYHDPSQLKTSQKREGTMYFVEITETNICVSWENYKKIEEKICREILR